VADTKFASPELLETDDYVRDSQLGVYDLIIYDQCVPKAPSALGARGAR
jgi:hypothetical protein